MKKPIECAITSGDPELLVQMDAWLLSPDRSQTFSAFLDSLDTRAVRRAKAVESKPVRPVFGNYATKRE